VRSQRAANPLDLSCDILSRRKEMLGSPFGLPATNRTKGGQTFPFAFSLAGTMQKILTTDDTDDTNDRESRDPRGRGGSAWRVAGSDFPSLLSVQILHPTVLPVYRISETPTTGRATGGRGSQAYGTAERSETDWSAATAAQRARRRARSTLRTKGQSNQLIPKHRSTETPKHRPTELPSSFPSVQIARPKPSSGLPSAIYASLRLRLRFQTQVSAL